MKKICVCPKTHKVRLCVLVHRSKYGWNTTATVSTHINTVFSEKSYLISDQSDIITPTAWRHWGSQTGAPVSGLAGRHSGSPSRPSHDTHTRMNMVEDTMITTENLCAATFIWIRPSLDLKNMIITTVHVSDSNTNTVNTGKSLTGNMRWFTPALINKLWFSFMWTGLRVYFSSTTY